MMATNAAAAIRIMEWLLVFVGPTPRRRNPKVWVGGTECSDGRMMIRPGGGTRLLSGWSNWDFSECLSEPVVMVALFLEQFLVGGHVVFLAGICCEIE